jgi:hypothetical protein
MEQNVHQPVRLSAGLLSRPWMVFCCSAVVLGSGFGVFGQTADPETPPPPPTAKTHPRDPTIWNTEAMMEDAVLQISRRYNLNKAQEKYTRLLLVERVTKFLDKHEDGVRQLLKESIDFQLDLRKGTPEAYKDWAERAVPIYKAARDAIWEGNMEWGQILTPAQKETHQKDLDQMEGNFLQVEQVLESLKAGEGLKGLVRGRKSRGGDHATKTGGQVTDDPDPIELRLIEDNWTAYVKRFIQTYQLDKKQQNSARLGILKEMRDSALEYRESRKQDFARIDAELKSLPGDPKKAKNKREALQRRKRRLEKPVQSMFVKMDQRLRLLLTAQQLAKADPENKKALDEMYDELAGTPGKKRKPFTGVKTRPDPKPAATQPGKARPHEAKPSKPDPKGGAEPAKARPKEDTPPKAEEPPGKDPKPKDPAKPGSGGKE